jgi:hypothetical protein
MGLSFSSLPSHCVYGRYHEIPSVCFGRSATVAREEPKIEQAVSVKIHGESISFKVMPLEAEGVE